MDKSEKIFVRTVAFLISTVISVSLFSLFSTWAWTHLEPTQQEAIAAINTPWIAAQSERAMPVNEACVASGDGAPDYRTVATSAARKR